MNRPKGYHCQHRPTSTSSWPSAQALRLRLLQPHSLQSPPAKRSRPQPRVGLAPRYFLLVDTVSRDLSHPHRIGDIGQFAVHQARLIEWDPDQPFDAFLATKIRAVRMDHFCPASLHPSRFTTAKPAWAAPIRPSMRPCGAGRISSRSNPWREISVYIPLSEKSTVCHGGQDTWSRAGNRALRLPMRTIRPMKFANCTVG